MSDSKIQAIETVTQKTIDKANSLIIKTEEDYGTAGEVLKGCRALKTEIRSSFDPIVNKAYQAHLEAISQRGKHLDPLEHAVKNLAKKMSDYTDEQDRILEEQRKKAERERIEAETKRIVEENEILKKAEEAETAGQEKLRDKILEDIPPVIEDPFFSFPPPRPIVKKTSGIVTTKRVIWEVADLAKIPRQFFALDKVKVGKYVKEGGIDTKIPGIRVFHHTSTHAKG